MKKLLILLVMSSIFLFGAVSVNALYYDESFYNSISWTWEYNAPYTTSYNCLGYATGSYTWEWPWGYEPTISEVKSYLESRGYTQWQIPYRLELVTIIAYGPSSSRITHFSKVLNGNLYECIAKWGSLERFKHYDWDPYYHYTDYGAPQGYFMSL